MHTMMHLAHTVGDVVEVSWGMGGRAKEGSGGVRREVIGNR